MEVAEMIRLYFDEPALNRFLHSLTVRMDRGHPRYAALADEYGRRAAAFHGERSFAFELHDFRGDDCVLLHGLVLKIGGMQLEIDALLLHPNFTALIDVKKGAEMLSGDGGVSACRAANAVQEAKNRLSVLVDWLAEHGVSVPAPKTLVLLDNAELILERFERIPANIYRRAEGLKRLLEWRGRDCAEPATFAELKAAADLLTEVNTRQLPAGGFAHEYKIHSDDVLPGVICPYCGALEMTRDRKTWRCLSCRHTCANAHLHALADWSRAFGAHITAVEARSFLGLPQYQQSRRLLDQTRAEKIGVKHNMHYDLLADERIRQRI